MRPPYLLTHQWSALLMQHLLSSRAFTGERYEVAGIEGPHFAGVEPRRELKLLHRVRVPR